MTKRKSKRNRVKVRVRSAASQKIAEDVSAQVPPAAPPVPPKFDRDGQFRQWARGGRGTQREIPLQNAELLRQMLARAKPHPGVVPKNHEKRVQMAMDRAVSASVEWATPGLLAAPFNQGYTFLGFAYLSELAQIPEYRLISEVIATEATRKWIKIESKDTDGDGEDEEVAEIAKLLLGDNDAEDTDEEDTDEEDIEQGGEEEQSSSPIGHNGGPLLEDESQKKAEKIKAIEAEFERLAVRETFQRLALQDGFFGRSHLYLDTGDTDKPDELKTPIGDGNKFTQLKFKNRHKKGGFLRALKVIEPIWAYPTNYDANNPLTDEWYKPETWFVMGTEIHESRILSFVTREVPDLLKPSFSFAGLSLTQMAKPYVDNWLETRQSVNDLIQAFSTMVLKTDMSVLLQGGAADSLIARLDAFNNARNNRGVMAVDKNAEDFANVSVSLSTLDKLQAQAQEHICSVSRIPLVKYTGLSPTGLNASSEGEIRSFYDTIHAYQENNFRDPLTVVFRMVQISLYGEVDEDLTFNFMPLWELSEEGQANVQKVQAETDKTLIDAGVLAPEESRGRIAKDPSSPYPEIDVDKVPEPPQQPEPGNLHERIDENEDDSNDGDDQGAEDPPQGGFVGEKNK